LQGNQGKGVFVKIKGWILVHKSKIREVKRLLAKHRAKYTLNLSKDSDWAEIKVEAGKRFFRALDKYWLENVLWGIIQPSV